jgi:aryl-alcohol dehydrogenase-like predicted oxidoreductase
LCLRHLGVERIDLLQLHRVDPNVPLADQIGELKKLQDEGKVAHIGMSEVDVDQLAAGREIAEIVSVQNMYNLADRDAEPVLQYAAANGIAFIPWFPLKTGKLVGPGSPLTAIAQRLGASASQVALAWLLHHSPVMLPIPGTSKVAHLDENVAAAALSLSDSDADELAATTAK